jgi:hypothetical protein
MNSYSSQTTNHVGYVVTLTIGIFVLISNKDIRDLFKKHRVWFYSALSLPISFIEYFASRIVFWAWMSNMVLKVTENQALSKQESTVIFGIQTYLTDIFTNNLHEVSIYGISSTFYRLGQKMWFGTILSFILLFALTFSLIYIFGFCSEYYHAKSCKRFINKLKERNTVIAIIAIGLICLICLILLLLTLL